MIQPRSAYEPASVLSIGGRRSSGTVHRMKGTRRVREVADLGRNHHHATDRAVMPATISVGYWVAVTWEVTVASQDWPDI
jgi:hypothetical protein